MLHIFTFFVNIFSIIILKGGDIQMKNNLLPQKLKELRKAHGYTQDYVASICDVARQTYSHYETGKRTPSSEILF
jgi:DNA-binding XRE family transcriptional regulator